jgi:hypothetical protein
VASPMPSEEPVMQMTAMAAIFSHGAKMRRCTPEKRETPRSTRESGGSANDVDQTS